MKECKKTCYECSCSINPSEFAARMRAIRDEFSDDEEVEHISMDNIMLELLEELGYSEAVAIFNDTPKWYA